MSVTRTQWEVWVERDLARAREKRDAARWRMLYGPRNMSLPSASLADRWQAADAADRKAYRETLRAIRKLLIGTRHARHDPQTV
jgi:hypothetical protein